MFQFLVENLIINFFLCNFTKKKMKKEEIYQKIANGEVNQEQGMELLEILSWQNFRSGFYAAKDCWNNQYAVEEGDNKWALLPDKFISNAWFKYKKENNE